MSKKGSNPVPNMPKPPPPLPPPPSSQTPPLPNTFKIEIDLTDLKKALDKAVGNLVKAAKKESKKIIDAIESINKGPRLGPH